MIENSNATSITAKTCLKNGAGGICLTAASYSNTIWCNWLKKNTGFALQDNEAGNSFSGNIFISYPVATFTANSTAIIAGQ